MNVIEQLNEIKDRTGFSWSAIAEMVGLRRTMLYNILHEKHPASEKTVQRVEEALNTLNKTNVTSYSPSFSERLWWACKFLFGDSMTALSCKMGVDVDDLTKIVNTHGNPTSAISHAFETRIQPLIEARCASPPPSEPSQCVDVATLRNELAPVLERLSAMETDVKLIKKLLAKMEE